MFCFFANDLALHDESEEDLRMMMRNLVEVCKTKVLKVSADKSDKKEEVGCLGEGNGRRG